MPRELRVRRRSQRGSTCRPRPRLMESTRLPVYKAHIESRRCTRAKQRGHQSTDILRCSTACAWGIGWEARLQITGECACGVGWLTARRVEYQRHNRYADKNEAGQHEEHHHTRVGWNGTRCRSVNLVPKTSKTSKCCSEGSN